MKKILVPTTSADDWKQFLAEPEKQWREGYSAMSLALSWEQAAPAMPKEITRCLDGPGDNRLHSPSLLFAIPEYKVHLPGGRRPSQTDLLVLCRNDNGLVCMAVEGKVDEPFGPTLEEKLKNPSEGVLERLEYLLDTLGLEALARLEPKELARKHGGIRYQLLHRAVSALLTAEEFHACTAVMMVHSFSKTDKWLSDYQDFACLFGKAAEIGTPIRAGIFGGVALYLAWAKGESCKTNGFTSLDRR